MAELKALIFDVDGTLADTERDGHRVAFNRTFAEAKLPWHWSVGLYGSLLAIAGGKERIRHFIEAYQPPMPTKINLAVNLAINLDASSLKIKDLETGDLKADAVSALAAHLHQAKTHQYRALLNENIIPLRPGIERLITQARQAGIRLAIATTSRLENAIALLSQTFGPDSPDWFEVIAAGDIVPHKKPAPDIYHYVLGKLALSPSDCLVFEDTAHGLTAATQAGLKTVVTLNDYTQNQDFTTALLVLNHLGEPNQPFTLVAGHPGYLPYYFDLFFAQALLKTS